MGSTTGSWRGVGSFAPQKVQRPGCPTTVYPVATTMGLKNRRKGTCGVGFDNEEVLTQRCAVPEPSQPFPKTLQDMDGSPPSAGARSRELDKITAHFTQLTTNDDPIAA